jgi:hypothetical protein
MTIEELEQRLRAAEDRLAILELEGMYAKTFDGRRGAEWAALFTEDGIYEGRDLPGPAGHNRVHVQGRSNLAEFCATSAFSGIHLMNVPQLTFDGDRATGRVHFTFHSVYEPDRYGGELGATIGYYDVAYERGPDGGWLIERRVTTPFTRTRATGFGYEPKGAFE